MTYIKTFKQFNESIEEDAPINATGVAVSTDQPIVRKKKKKKQYEIWKRASLEKK